MLWKITVTEIVSVPATYTIEAGTLEEARGKASKGETVAEERSSRYEVLDRHIGEVVLEDQTNPVDIVNRKIQEVAERFREIRRGLS